MEITNVEITGEKVTVSANFKKPAPGQSTDDIITYPYDLEEIPATGLPVEFLAEGDEIHVPSLFELDYVKPISASSYGIKVFTPTPGEVVERNFTVEGIGSVFEGTIQYRLSDDKGEVIIRGFTTATMGNWRFFRISMLVDETLPAGEELLLELFTDSPKDGSIQEKLSIDLILK